MPGLWRNQAGTREGKYLVQRRDGTVPEWSWFVLGARDPAAAIALRAYAAAAEQLGYDPEFVKDIDELAAQFVSELAALGEGDPYATPHRKDDPAIVELMKTGKSA